MVTRRQMLSGLGAVTLTGCSGSTPDPASLLDLSQPDPLPAFRLFADAGLQDWARHMDVARMRANPNILALSGGGEDGAFGAGALNGWTEAGTRPRFDVVTGISTGALIAPFAFLGAAGDDTLRQIFTQYDSDDIVRARGLPGLLGGSIYDTSGLAGMIETYTPQPLLDAIAARHADGARLLVVTSNLYTARAVIWNMGAIARAGQVGLFRAVMLASSALPALFPPVTIRYVAQGRTIRETHIDGGIHLQFLAVPEAMIANPQSISSGGHLYVLINNTLIPAPQQVELSILGVSQHALTTMVRASAAETVRTARLFAHQRGVGFSVASINADSGVVYDPSRRFDGDYMRALYDYGFARGKTGTLWNP